MKNKHGNKSPAQILYESHYRYLHGPDVPIRPSFEHLREQDQHAWGTVWLTAVDIFPPGGPKEKTWSTPPGTQD